MPEGNRYLLNGALQTGQSLQLFVGGSGRTPGTRQVCCKRKGRAFIGEAVQELKAYVQRGLDPGGSVGGRGLRKSVCSWKYPGLARSPYRRRESPEVMP